MKVLVIGDPHGSKKIKEIRFKDVDAILIPGDIGKADLARKNTFKKIENLDYEPSKRDKIRAYLEIYNSTIKMLKFLSKKAPVYFIYGNVEQKDPEIKKESKEIGYRLPLLGKTIKKIKNIHLINNRKINLKGLVIAGNEYFVERYWVKRFAPKDRRRLKSAKKEMQKAKKFYSKLGKVDVLLCHQPPYGILDKVSSTAAPKLWRGKNAGSKIILSYIKKKQPRYVFCGHIHEAKGKKKVGETIIYNVGCCGDYLLVDINK